MTTTMTITNLHKVINNKVLLNQVSLLVPEGKITTVVGKSGAGKSILLKSIVGLFIPDSGTVMFHNTDLLHTHPRNAKQLRQKIGYLFQHAALFDFLTVEENIAFPLRESLKMSSKDEIAHRVQESLEWVNLERSHSMYPHELSGGMQKRVAVARTLVLRPELFLFDEPTTGLDPVLTTTIMKLIVQVNRDLGISCVVITHDYRLAYEISDRIIFMSEGSILFTGSPQEFMDVQHPEIQAIRSHTGVFS